MSTALSSVGIISIHAPREGSDCDGDKHVGQRVYFNPRSPRGERRIININSRRSRPISIHAPREGSDINLFVADAHTLEFQSTLPARGATFVGVFRCGFAEISIHAPREGSDKHTDNQDRSHNHFNPRSPRGERRFSSVF